MQILVIFLVLTLASVLSSPINAPCVVTRKVSESLTQKWFFDNPAWDHQSVRYVSQNHNIPPMTGDWSFELTFCATVRLEMGNILNSTGKLLGWSFGVLTTFDLVETVPTLKENKVAALPVRNFVQTYQAGDWGAPCPNGRTATVNVYCGQNSTCADVPGAGGAICLGGSLSNGFCLCSFGFNTTNGMCNGLWFNILSNKCPTSEPYYPDQPVPPPTTAALVAAIFGVLISLFGLCWVGGYIYNYTVHTKRGLEAVPFHDTCTGMSKSTTYTGIPR